MRERERGTAPPKKRVLNREVSMSRGFKPKAKSVNPPEEDAKSKVDAKKIATRDNTDKKGAKREGITLVAATPIKPKPARSQSQSTFGQRDGGARTQSFSLAPFGTEDDDDDEWRLPSSPDILLLGADASSEDDAGGARVLVRDTPTKRPRMR